MTQHQETRPIYIHCRTPFHPGSGSSLGIVDLPIQRERHTGYPKFEASGLKGCLREHFTRKDENKTLTNLIFGPEKDGSEHAGMVCFTDARILLFPVKSLKGVFAYITCPDVLKRFFSELDDAGLTRGFDKNEEFASNSALLSTDTKLMCSGNKLVLEEYTFKAAKKPIVNKLAEFLAGMGLIAENDLKARLAILPDNEFRYFVEMTTETITRIRIDQTTGTVADSALFSEEFLPAESVLYSFAMASGILMDEKKRKDQEIDKSIGNQSECTFLLNTLAKGLLREDCTCVLQMGGDASIGKGLVRLSIGGTEL